MKGACTEHALEGMTEIGPFQEPPVQQQFLMYVEMKTATTCFRVHEEMQLARQHGYFIYLHIVHQQDLFKQVIPSTAHRLQVVQHCVALTASFGLYVVADTGVHGIIRAVLIYACA